LSLLHKVGEPLPSHSKASTLTTFSSTLKSCGFREFIKRKDLESSSFSVEDSFRIRCDVTVVREIVTKVTEYGSASTAPSPSPSAGPASLRPCGWCRRSQPAGARRRDDHHASSWHHVTTDDGRTYIGSVAHRARREVDMHARGAPSIDRQILAVDLGWWRWNVRRGSGIGCGRVNISWGSESSVKWGKGQNVKGRRGSEGVSMQFPKP